MPEQTYKVVEIVGTSEVSISKAIESAIAKASGSLRHLDLVRRWARSAATSVTAR